MNQISFDIIYKKKTDNDVFRLSNESEFHQLKLMICGKYKIYDTNKVYIYYKDNLLSYPDNSLLKEIFKNIKKAKIEISDKLILKKKENIKYFCKCRNGANYICDKCDEFLCEFCYKKKKHISHINKLIKICEYPSYLKTILKDYATELDDKILNDEGYKFFQFWNVDLQNEINNINNCYEYIKNLIEDVKQIQIDYLINICDENKYLNLKNDIEKVIEEYANITIDNDFENVVKQKKKLFDNSKEILIQYSELKQILLNYTKTIKDIQVFNQIIMKEIKDKFNVIKKKYNLTNLNNSLYNMNSYNYNINNNNNSNNNYNSVNYTNLNSQREKSPTINSNLNFLPNQITSPYLTPVNVTSNINLNGNSISNNNNILNIKNQINNSTISNNKEIKEKLIFKLKDERKILCFSPLTQTFKEKVFSDKGNFKKELSSESDISQLNLNNKLYILSGKNFNKFYNYDISQNSIFFINNTLYSHYYGVLTYCNKNDSIYLIGGNNQIKCEKLKLNNNKKNFEWEQIPSLNEERQEFASMSFNDYIYIFFGFSLKKGINLSSIERINIDLNDKFEVIYLNEQISLSSLSCAKYIEESGEINNENEILLLGGFDGNNYIDTSLVFNIQEMKIRDCDIVIPNINTHYQFLFQSESNFIQIEDAQVIFDMKNNIHLLTKNSYYLFSENH